MLLYTMHENKYYGSDTYVLQRSLASNHDLAIGFSFMVIHYSNEGS